MTHSELKLVSTEMRGVHSGKSEEQGDHLVLSKGHACPGLYAARANYAGTERVLPLFWRVSNQTASTMITPLMTFW